MTDLFNLIKKIRFIKDHNSFQTKSNKDLKKLKNSKSVWVRADEWKNIYKTNPSNYHKILRNKITDSYKINRNYTIPPPPNDDTLKCANELHIEDRLETFEMKDAYIQFKDHKYNFENKLESRWINPSKTELGIISKILLKILCSIYKKTTLNKFWKNSTHTIERFRNMENKSKDTSIHFDIIHFYLSTSKKSFNYIETK